jgi:spermidine synthase
LTARNAGIHRALKAVFRDVLVLPGTTNILLASNRPLERDPEVLVRRFARRRLETRLVTPAYIRYVHTNDRFFEIQRELDRDPTPANTDVRPLCYRYAGLIWLSQFFPRLMHQDATGAWAGPVGWAASAMGMVGLAGLILWARRSPGRTRVLLVAAAGFIGMMLETMLLLYYQAKSGVLYQDIGLLLTAFMAGLAGGAGFVSLTIKGGRFEALSDTLAPNLKLGFLVLGLASFFMVHFSAAPGLWPTFLLLLAAGFLVAGVFAWAGLAGGADQHALIGPLYAADLIGGSLGSLAGSLVLIPFLGLPETALLAAALALATLFMI